jgi:hypothetical protein
VPAAVRQLYLQAAVLQQQQPQQLAGRRCSVITAVNNAAETLLNLLQDDDSRRRLMEKQDRENAAAAAAVRASGAAAAAEQQPVQSSATSFSLQAHTKHESHSLALTAPAVLLVIEVMQLLAATCDQNDVTDELWAQATVTLEQLFKLLRQQLGMLAACASPGYGIRRSVVLRQSGQQLLQLLRWHIESLAKKHIRSNRSSSSSSRSGYCAEVLGDAAWCYKLRSTLNPLVWATGAWDPQSGDAGETCCYV